MTFNVVKSFSSFIIINGDTCKCTRCNRVYTRDTDDKNYWRSVICGHTDNKEVKSSANNFNNLKGRIFGNWAVLQYSGERMWQCECLCSKHTLKEVSAYSLTSGKSLSCGQCNSTVKSKVNVGDHFGEWTVIALEPKYKALCECSCEAKTRKSINVYSLLNGTSTSCGKGHDRNSWNVKDITGMKFGDLTAEEYVGNGYWKCRCNCGNTRIAKRSHLLDGRAHRCLEHFDHGFEDLTGQIFGRLTVDEYAGDKKWWCTCGCGNKERKLVRATNLKNGSTKSCGCLALEGSSMAEQEVAALFPGCKRCVRDIIPPQELDIYIPEKKLAIEFNGTYWHNSDAKSQNYHQEKTIACLKKGIHLIHIFEYEWNNNTTREKIVNMLTLEKKRVYARDTDIIEISNELANTFENKYHLQNGCQGQSIALACVKKENNEILGVMTFGTPRFNKKYQYEMIRLCWRDDIDVIGGSEKLFKHFINKYNPISVISYCNLAKFNGRVYSKLGFNCTEITKPNYVWINHKTGDVLKRYQTQKHKLVENGLGREDQTEDEIMKDLDFYKIYDSGNAVFVWKK